MNVRKFVALSARDALRKVKELLGPDAVILSNRTVPDGVEIMAVAASDMEMMVSTPAQEVKPQPVNNASACLSPFANQHTPDARIFSEPQALAAQDVPPLMPRPIPIIDLPSTLEDATPVKPAEIVPTEVVGEIRALRKIVEQHLAGFAWGESARSEPVKTEILRQMLDAGFSPRLARDLLAELPRDLDVSHAQSWVRAEAERVFLTVNAENDIINRGGVYALVGPTGVGKTTTTAKLAARCVLCHGASKVALITTDGYRIGAHEQLRIYGRILGVSVSLVKNAEELQRTLQELQHKHMVLIDTMGMSQRDKMVEEQVAMFGNSNVKRLLLLSATGRGDTLDDVVRAYSGPDLAGCILSKVDEAATLATSLDVVIRHKLPLYYISDGQRVPEDLHLPDSAHLLRRAFNDLPESSPHHLAGLEPGLMMANAPSKVAAAGGGCG